VESFLTEYNKAWITQRADPYVYRHNDGKYYFTASVPSYDRIILRSSDKLSTLSTAKEKVIWKRHEKGPMSEHIWAPELHYLFGKWYIYFAAGEQEDKWKIRPYVLECSGEDPMEDEWVELGKMQAAKEDEFSFQAFSLDATVLEHQGSYYYLWAEKVGVARMISNLYIAKLESANRLSTVQVLLTTPDYDWERKGFWVTEGPAVLKKNGNIYVTYSASATDASYCIGMLTAKEDADLLDPQSWKKERNPVLVTQKEKGIFGPGHNSFTKSSDGRDIMVFHARQYEHLIAEPLYDPNRHAMLLEVAWDIEGKPVFEYQSKEFWEYD
jgi:GH43 family beta-xylosidase